MEENEALAINIITGMFKVIILIALPLLCLSTPVLFAEVPKINKWWPPEDIMAGLGTPGYAI